MTLDWDPPIEDAGSPITGYRIRWGLDAEWSAVGYPNEIIVVAPPVTVTLPTDDDYGISVNARNAIGDGRDRGVPWVMPRGMGDGRCIEFSALLWD